jgi:hypothetical protein
MLAGCSAPDVWERSLQTGPDASMGASAPSARVVVRRVPWERVDTTLAEIEKEIASSDIHPDEWSPDQRLALKARLLKGLQVSQDPSGVMVLGNCRVRTTDDLAEAEKSLSEIARSLGADMVVWTTAVLGKADKIVDRPVTTSTWGTGWFRDSNGDRRPDTYTEHSTSWVPVRITVNESAGVAYFLLVGG